MINGPKWPFFTILPLFWAAMGSNIFFFFTYSMPVGHKLLIEKIIENFFSWKSIFLAFLAKNPHSVRRIEDLFCPKLLIEKFLEKDLFMKIDIFSIFGPKTGKMGHAQNYKNGQKSIFHFERWKFFSSHLNHLGRQFFCIFYTFWFDKNYIRIFIHKTRTRSVITLKSALYNVTIPNI